MTDQTDPKQADPKPDQPKRIPVAVTGATPPPAEKDTAASVTESIEDRAEILDRIKRIEVKEPAEDESADDLVKDYESRYFGFRENEHLSDSAESREEGSAQAAKMAGDEDIWADIPQPSFRSRSRSVPVYTGAPEKERTWAALAHASMILTVLFGLSSGGLLALLTIFIPLVIYLAYRQRSEFVAYHALQAFVMQAIGTVGWAVVLLAGVLVGVIISTVMAITVIGLPVAFVTILATILFVVVSLVMPLAMIVYGAIAAWEAHLGVRYRIPFVGDWIDRQMHTGFLKSL